MSNHRNHFIILPSQLILQQLMDQPNRELCDLSANR